MTIAELRAVDLGVSVAGRTLLTSVDLVAGAGQWTTVTGPSGSGKSVLIQVLAGLLPATRGEVLIDGRPAWIGPDRQPPPGIVAQDYALVPWLTAAETVSLPLQAGRVARPELRARRDSALDALGLAATADQLVENLSGGQRQRVAIARALAVGSPLLFLDEPTAELDPANRDLVLALLRRQVDSGAVLIVVSHDPAIVEASDAVLALSAEGALVAAE